MRINNHAEGSTPNRQRSRTLGTERLVTRRAITYGVPGKKDKNGADTVTHSIQDHMKTVSYSAKIKVSTAADKVFTLNKAITVLPL